MVAAWIAYLANGVVELTDQAGEVLESISCPVSHGAARDEATGLGIFACMGDVVVVDETAEVTRLAYPGPERIGGFLETDAGLVGYSAATLCQSLVISLGRQVWSNQASSGP